MRKALAEAQAGEVIRLAPGDYRLGGRVTLRARGTPEKPIIVRSQVPGTAVVYSDAGTYFKLYGAHWQFRGLDFQGSSGAAHAFHIVNDADGVVLKGNRFQNFHAAIKANGEGADPRRFPDGVRVMENVFVNDAPRKTDGSVVAIDVVGGREWRIARNFVADIAREGRAGAHSTALFVKGGASKAVIDANLVMCEWRHSGGGRVGLSLGGGGTGAAYMDRRSLGACEGDCPEAVASRVTNNIVLNCPDEPGIYLNQAKGGQVANNTIYNAYGIQARFPETRTEIADNLLTGTIWEREGARVRKANNLHTGLFDSASYLPGLRDHLTYRISDYHELFPSWIGKDQVTWVQGWIRTGADWLAGTWMGRRPDPFREWFVSPEAGILQLQGGRSRIVDQGARPAKVDRDFCGQLRDAPADLGAIEYSAGQCRLSEELVRRYGSLFTDLTE
ncbi:MAG: hypothetical protein V5A50_13850 [Thiohalorhabdus sp.]|uniref:hypothetical protein n=1 Tax=Thiohalorhabdus sp. TaxID=3094134 RepID=UPI002FC2E375